MQLKKSKYYYVIQLIQFNSHLLTQFKGFKYRKGLSIFIWSIEGTLTGITIPGQNRHESNVNKSVLRIPQNSRTGTSLSDCLVSYPEHSLG